MTKSAIKALLSELGISDDYGVEPFLPAYAEAATLVEIGTNIVGRPQTLAPDTAAAWRAMVAAAAQDDIQLLVVSGFRSFEYQAEIIRKKLKGGQIITDILQVNVAPGFSQHHTGNAIDIASPGFKPLTEEFENSPAFAWLAERAAEFDFRLSYPRNNPDGISYEPWHWYRT